MSKLSPEEYEEVHVTVRDLALKQAKVECRIVIRVGAAAISWQVSARGMFEFCLAA